MSAKGKGKSKRSKSMAEGGLSGRSLHTKVRSAKGRKLSSTLWLQRQLNDPYVVEAQKRGYPSRAAFKLLELDDKYHFLKPGKRIVDLGAAPGGWTKVAAEGCSPGGAVVAVGGCRSDIGPNRYFCRREQISECDLGADQGL